MTPPYELDEVLEGYIETYGLNDDLPVTHRNKILRLVKDQRELKRAKAGEVNLPKALAFIGRRIVELKVFHAHEHEGYNQLIAFLERSLAAMTLEGDGSAED